MQKRHKDKIRIRHLLPQEIRAPILPQQIPRLLRRRLHLLPPVLRRRFLDLKQRRAEHLLARLVEVRGRRLVEQVDDLGDDVQEDGADEVGEEVAHLDHDGVVEVQRGRGVLCFEGVGDGPRVHFVGAVGVLDGWAAVVCEVAWGVFVVGRKAAVWGKLVN